MHGKKSKFADVIKLNGSDLVELIFLLAGHDKLIFVFGCSQIYS